MLSTVVYIAVGYHVFQQRNQLRNLTFSSRGRDAQDGSSSEDRDSADKVRFGNKSSARQRN